MTTASLTVGTTRSTVSKVGRFGLVGVAGLVVNVLVQALLAESFGVRYLAAAIVATQASSTFNFVVSDRWVFGGGSVSGATSRYVSFLIMNNTALLLRAPIMWALVEQVNVHYSIANVLSLVVLTGLRFGIADRVIWRGAGPGKAVQLRGDSQTGPSVGKRRADEISIRPHAVSDRMLQRRFETQSTELSRRFQWLSLSCIVALGAFVRCWQLMASGYNSDEAVYASQAAAIAGDPSIVQFFPVYRAHPLLFQALLSVLFQFGTSDLVGRLASVAFGLATIVLVFVTGRLLFGARAGILAALIVAIMPYHVVVTRQVLLDGPMTFFATLSMYLLARFVMSERAGWLYAASAALGLTVLAKETYIILVGSVFMFFALSPEVRLRLRDAVTAIAVFVLVLIPFPITVVLAGKSETGKSYLSWQLFRRPNHGVWFYPTTVPSYIGYAVLLGAVIALIASRGMRRTWRERLLLSWTLVPVIFLEVWPVKGFHYLLAASMPIALLAGNGLTIAFRETARRAQRRARGRFSRLFCRPRAVWSVGVAAVALSLAAPTWSLVQPATSDSFLAGTGGLPGGREAGEWISGNVPVGAEIMTVGPSMANLVQYYGHRRAYGLSVSLNPLNRNPSYVPITNPDRAIRTNNLQYIVWDSYSTRRSQFFGDKLLAYVDRYHGRAVYTYLSDDKPVIVVYEVRP